MPNSKAATYENANSENVGSVLQVALDEAKGQLSQAEKAVREKSGYAVAETEKYVGGHPWTALAVAGSIGIVIGLLLTRR